MEHHMDVEEGQSIQTMLGVQAVSNVSQTVLIMEDQTAVMQKMYLSIVYHVCHKILFNSYNYYYHTNQAYSVKKVL